MRVSLRNGLDVELRPLGPLDREPLRSAFARLSPESKRKRFLAPKPRLTSTELTYLTSIDQRNHVAIAAVDFFGDIIGVGRFVRLPDAPDTAEFAVTVSDAWQGQGLGGALTRALREAARARGIKRMSATMLADNEAAHRMVAAIAPPGTPVAVGDGVVEMVVDLPD